MLTTTVQFETFKVGESGQEHMLGYYMDAGEVVASFMERVTGTRRWRIVEPPPELTQNSLLQEFVDELQATTNAKALVTPTQTYK